MELPDDETLERLKLSPEVAWYLVTRGYDLPTCPPRIKTPEPRDVEGAYFDPARVDKVVRAFALLRHTQGKWAGRPLILRAWQVAYLIGPTYGWVREDEDGVPRRIVRTQYLDIPRKNAKTTIGGGQCVYLTAADGEPGGQVYALATSEKQARFAFDPVRRICLQAPALRKNVKVLTNRITHPASGSVFSVLASLADGLHGASPHGALIDELHLHKNRELVEAVESGTGARSQPLIIFATTADAGAPETVYAEKRHYCEQLAAGVFEDPSFYGVVFAADEAADPFSPITWATANPGYAAGDSPTHQFLVDEAKKAQNDPKRLASFQRLHLGVRTKQRTRYITLEAWDANAGVVDEAALAGRAAFGGLDLGNVADLSALVWLLPSPAGGFDVLWRFWIAGDAVPKLDKRTGGAISRWITEGHIVQTPGPTTDYDAVLLRARADRELLAVTEIGFDPWNANDVTKTLDEEGAPMVSVRQGYPSLSPALKELKRVLLNGAATTPLLRHGGNPVARWMTDNLAVAEDPAGNVKPDKAHSAEKIDGWSALTTAMSRAMAAQERQKRSAYADHPFEVI